MNNHSVSNDADGQRRHEPAGQQVEIEFLAVDDNRVARVVAALR